MSEIVARDHQRRVPVKDLVDALLKAEAWSPLRRALTHYGSEAVGAVLEFFGKPGTIAIPKELFDRADFETALARTSVDLDRLEAGALAVLTTIWDPRSLVVRRSKIEHWALVSRGQVKFADEMRNIRSAAFLLALGLGRSDQLGAELISRSFALVYVAAARNLVGASVWEQLEPTLPWFSPSWDKCGRLVRAAARAFADRSWPPALFCRTFSNPDLLVRAVDDVGRMWGGSRYLRQLRNSALDRSLVATEEQRAILARLKP